MGGSTMDDDWELTPLSNGVRTVVLVGRTGNGKSATGNSILGTKAFKSKFSSSGVTNTSELKHKILSDGQRLNVIDTPGFFDLAAGSEFVVSEIVKCIDLAKEGFHAILVVFSIRARFSEEEDAALRSLRTLFGDKIINYIIIIFTGGDDLEEDGETLDDYLGRDCPKPLKEVLDLCGNRQILFDNKTKDESKKKKQVDELLSLVNEVVTLNNGKPYSDELFSELQEGATKFRDQREEVESLNGYTMKEIAYFKEQIEKSYEGQLKRITAMVELKLRETTSRLEKQLAKEQKARKQAEEYAQSEQKKSKEEIRKLRSELERTEREHAEFRERNGNANRCAIL